jgi:hypothetical protein
MSRRRVIVIALSFAGAAVVAAVLALIVTSRPDSAARPETGPAPPASPTVAHRPEPSPSPRVADATSAARGSRSASDRDHRELVRDDGTPVRDHRTDSNADPDLSASPVVPLKRARVHPDVIVAVRRALRPIVKQCAQDYAADIQAEARLRVRLAVSIASGALTVGEVDVDSANVRDRALATCVGEAARTLAPAERDLPTVAEHEDVSHHMLTFPFRLPPD